MKKLLPLILTTAALLAPSAASANDLSSLGFYELIYGNQPTSTVRKRTSAPAYDNFYDTYVERPGSSSGVVLHNYVRPGGPGPVVCTSEGSIRVGTYGKRMC